MKIVVVFIKVLMFRWCNQIIRLKIIFLISYYNERNSILLLRD